jgi:hypothetical protein
VQNHYQFPRIVLKLLQVSNHCPYTSEVPLYQAAEFFQPSPVRIRPAFWQWLRMGLNRPVAQILREVCHCLRGVLSKE